MHSADALALNGGCATSLVDGLCCGCASGRIPEPLGRVQEAVVGLCHYPAPVLNITNDCLPTFSDLDAFNTDGLICLGAIPFQGFNLAREGPRKLIERSFC